MGVGLLSYMGSHYYGIHLSPHIELVNKYVPRDGSGDIHTISYDQLKVGIFHTHKDNQQPASDSVQVFLDNLKNSMREHENDSTFSNPSAVLLVEEWQSRLKRITLRILWLHKGEEEA
jgi:hypothetical protein